jgi:hypothetical protein
MELTAPIKLQIDRMAWEKDPRLYFKENLRVQDEHGKIVPLVPNPHQDIILKEIQRQRGLGIPVRIIILKPRKTGSSTIGAAEIYHSVRFRPADAKIIAHDIDTTQYLFRICDRFYKQSPTEEQFATEASNRRELIFKQGGSITIATAGTKTAGRGSTPLYLLCSEAAYYENAKEVMNSMLNAVPDTPESCVIVESTANGMGGYFFEMWDMAKKGQSAFVPIFLSWKDFPKYSMPVPDSARFEQSLTQKEKQLRAKYRLSLEQLYWRRWVINTKLKGDEDLFSQEFPLDDITAFLTSGRPRFDREAIMSWPIEDPVRGYLEYRDTYGDKQIVFVPNKEGWLHVWKRPQPGRDYLAGADVAEGIEIADAPADDRYDYSCSDIFDRHTGEQVAQIHGHFEPDEFGRQLNMLGRWYNTAFIGVERNSNGLTVINELEHQKYPGHRIYARTYTPDGGRFSTPQKGWLTTPVTRPTMINHLAQSIRERALIMHSRETQLECLQFIIKPNGRPEAQTGSKDDRVFSLSIANEMFQHSPSEAPGDEPEKRDDWMPWKTTSHRPDKYERILRR